MSMVKRLAQGNLAALITMAFNVLAQVLIVPVFLHHWSTVHYGTWIAVITTISLLTLLDLTHQDYLGFESMKLRSDDRNGRSAIISDAMPVIAATAVVQIGIVLAIMKSGVGHRMLGLDQAPALGLQATNAVVSLFALWCFYQNFAGILVRVLTSLGYFAIGAWWGLANAVGVALAPMLAVVLGGDFHSAVLAQIAFVLVVNTAIYAHYHHLLRANGITIRRPDVRAGLHRYVLSLGLSVANIAEFMQQAGFRLAVLPLIGARSLVQFSTHRTIANVAQQGVGTLINPALPELMRLIEERDQTRINVLLTSLFYLTVVLVSPVFVILQLFVGAVFQRWTAGKVDFDPVTFITLSVTVLVYCSSQPSRALIRGHNLVKEQAFVSLLTGAMLVGLAIALVERYGVLGAAACLLVAELLRSSMNIFIAGRLLAKRRLSFPWTALVTSLSLVGAATIAMTLIWLFPNYTIYTIALFSLAWIAVNVVFWFSTPSQVKAMVLSRVGSMLGTSRAFTAPKRNPE